MGNGPSHHEPLDRAGIRLSRRMDKAFTRSFREKSLKKQHHHHNNNQQQTGASPTRRMDRLRRSLRESFRAGSNKRKEQVPEAAKPHQWQNDEHAVRAGTCSFHVKYLGCVEVFESRGMQVCEEALKVLRSNTRRRPVKAILYVSGDGLRVVEDETKGLIVDQTIEKVSFCAPDRNHEKGFSYICRDGTTRRWMCHGFLALRESGERLSHAVGCAFAACLERKQRRDKECGVTMMFDAKNSTFTRTGSFRATTITERLDPQLTKPAIPDTSEGKVIDIGNDAPPPVKPAWNPYAIERPHATPSMLERQGSFRGFQQLPGASPFKRQLSLRISELPSNLERQRSLSLESSNDNRMPHLNALASLKSQVSPIPEIPIAHDPVSAMCQQLSQGLSLLTSTTEFFDNSINEPTEKEDAIIFSPTDPQPTSLSWAPQQQPPTTTTANTVTTTTTTTLPNPDQWLGTVTNGVVGESGVMPSRTPSPRRAPPLANIRSALSLDASSSLNFVNGNLSGSANSLGSNTSSGIGTTSGTVSINSGTFAATNVTQRTPPHHAGVADTSCPTKDPFDADWVPPAVSTTNPFISPPSSANTSTKVFEVRL